MLDPWFKTTLHFRDPLGGALRFRVPHGVFATQAIDDGTKLLLEHLPPGVPGTVLDLGCGYGALGLPLAARFPGAMFTLVDRDLLAVHWCRLNAAENGLANVAVEGGLGFREAARKAPFDWILCNVPARAGPGFFTDLFVRGGALLREGGEVRAVILRDLVAPFEAMGRERGLPLRLVATGARHAVVAMSAGVRGSASEDPEALYGLEGVEIASLPLIRPHDLGGDEPERLRVGLPLLVDAMPRTLCAGRALLWRVGYGAVPLLARRRYPEIDVVVVERDLLAAAFTRLNAERLGLGGPRLGVREVHHLPEALGGDERFAWAAGELSPSAGEAVAEAELAAVAGALTPGGFALILALEKVERRWLPGIARRRRLRIARLAFRAGWSVSRLDG